MQSKTQKENQQPKPKIKQTTFPSLLSSIFPATKERAKTDKTKIESKIEKGRRELTSMENTIKPNQERFQSNMDLEQSNRKTNQ